MICDKQVIINPKQIKDLLEKCRKITDTEQSDIYCTNFESLSTNIADCLEQKLAEKRNNWNIVALDRRYNDILEVQSLVNKFNENTIPSANLLKDPQNLEHDFPIAANSVRIYRKYYGLECELHNSTEEDICGTISDYQGGVKKSTALKINRQTKQITRVQHGED